MTDDEQIIYSDQEFIGGEPGWILRSGISLVVIITLLLISLTWFVRYPDIVTGQAIITYKNPPYEFIARQDTQLAKRWKYSGDNANAGEPIFLLDSSTNYESLIALENNINLVHDVKNFAALPEFDYVQNLGELQNSYNDLIKSFSAIKHHLTNNVGVLRLQELETKSYELGKLIKVSQGVADKYQQKVVIQDDIIARNRAVLAKQQSTNLDILMLENQKIDLRIAYDNILISLSNYQSEKAEFERMIAELKLEQEQKVDELAADFNVTLSAFRNAITQWKKNHLFTAPFDGEVTYLGFWDVNQNIESGTVIATITQPQSNLTCKLQLNHVNTGKVEMGQRVLIALDNFPVNEFGYLVGEVIDISLVPNSSGYIANIDIQPNQSDKRLASAVLSPNMIGAARIITDDRRLPERFIENIIGLL